MEYEIFRRQLDLLLLLTGNNSLTTVDICEKIGISRRSVYRYIEAFRAAGFDVVSRGGVYSLTLESPLLDRLSERIRLKPKDIRMMAEVLQAADSSKRNVQCLRNMFHNLYGIEFDGEEFRANIQEMDNAETLRRAIGGHRQVVLRNYESPHGHTVKDRLVEPFRIIPQTNDVRCYEVESGMCKTFRISRIKGGVALLDTSWQYQQQHVTYYTDVFGFSGEHTHRITLRLGRLATRILMEDYGVPETSMALVDDGHWLYSTQVCSYHGVGRFILGLTNDIEIVRNEELRAFVCAEMEKALQKFSGHLPAATSPLD